MDSLKQVSVDVAKCLKLVHPGNQDLPTSQHGKTQYRFLLNNLALNDEQIKCALRDIKVVAVATVLARGVTRSKASLSCAPGGGGGESSWSSGDLSRSDVNLTNAASPMMPPSTVAIVPSYVAPGFLCDMPLADSLGAFGDVDLIEVTINLNRMTEVSVPYVAEFVSYNRHISSLELLGNGLTDAAATPLADLIVACPHLKRLKVADNSFTAVGMKRIAEALRTAAVAVTPSQLVQLNVGGNPIGDDGVKSVVEATISTSVQILGLRDVGMGPEGWACCGLLCAPAHRESASSNVIAPIQELQLKGNKATLSAIESFALSALAVDPSRYLVNNFSPLRSLAMGSCGITSHVAARLTDVLMVMPHLTHLDLNDNDSVGDTGMTQLCRWLRSSSSHSMKSLTLQNVGLSAEGAAQIADALTVQRGTCVAPIPLQYLDLGGNVLGADGSPHVARMLCSTPFLEKLFFRGCNLAGPGCSEIVQSLCALTHLQHLDFSGNLFGEHGSCWGQLLLSSASLRRLLLTDNAMPYSVTSQIAKALMSSPHRSLVVFHIAGKCKVANQGQGNLVQPTVQSSIVRLIERNREHSTHPDVEES